MNAPEAKKTWKELAEALQREGDTQKIVQLAEALNQALVEEELKRHPHTRAK